MILDDVRLGAYADGELAPEEAARIEAEAAADPDLAARIGRLRDLRHAVASAYEETLSEPSPERLLAAIRRAPAEAGPRVVPLAERRARREGRPAAAIARWGAVAASLVLAFGVGRYLDHLGPTPPLAAGPDGLMAQGDLAAGLERQLASTPQPGAPLKIGVSFQANDGRYCRTFILRQAKPVAGLACRDPTGWRLAMAMDAEPEAGGAGGYRTAADETPTPILDRVDALIKGQPLDAAAEAEARNSGWRPR